MLKLKLKLKLKKAQVFCYSSAGEVCVCEVAVCSHSQCQVW